jgi:hypothetical protein
VQCQLLRSNPHCDLWGVFGLSNEQRAAGSGLYCLCGQRWQLLPVIDRDGYGLHSVSWRHVPGSLAFPDGGQHGLHPLLRRKVRNRHGTVRRLHELLQRGGPVRAAGDLAYCKHGLHLVRRGHLRGSLALPDDRQLCLHSLHCRVHHRQRLEHGGLSVLRLRRG